MHKTTKEAEAFAREILKLIPDSLEREVAIAPPFTALPTLALLLKGSPINLAAQNVHDKLQGAFTGEISAPMLVDIGCSYVIVGHSERRSYFGETDEWVNRKVKAVIACGMRPILCVGETLEEREKGLTFSTIGRQLKEGLQDVNIGDNWQIVIAYEPVWAIGTGQTATPSQAEEVQSFIRQELGNMLGRKVAEETRILYGGSVTPGNIAGLMAEEDIDGALVGGASLKVEDFISIITYKEKG